MLRVRALDRLLAQVWRYRENDRVKEIRDRFGDRDVVSETESGSRRRDDAVRPGVGDVDDGVEVRLAPSQLFRHPVEARLCHSRLSRRCECLLRAFHDFGPLCLDCVAVLRTPKPLAALCLHLRVLQSGERRVERSQQLVGSELLRDHLGRGCFALVYGP